MSAIIWQILCGFFHIAFLQIQQAFSLAEQTKAHMLSELHAIELVVVLYFHPVVILFAEQQQIASRFQIQIAISNGFGFASKHELRVTFFYKIGVRNMQIDNNNIEFNENNLSLSRIISMKYFKEFGHPVDIIFDSKIKAFINLPYISKTFYWFMNPLRI